MKEFEACLMVARSLFAEIGPWGNKCALIGGLLPSLLVPDYPDDLDPHIGTTDVDLAIRVATTEDDPELYRTLKRNFLDMGLTQNSQRPIEWNGKVGDFNIIIELFAPSRAGDTAGRSQNNPIEQCGSGLKALAIDGLEYIERDIITVTSTGPLMNDKGIKDVELRICGTAMLICLKGWALKQRTKPKDGYDVVWLLKAQSPRKLAEHFLSTGLQETEFGQKALDYLLETFESIEHTGPKGWSLESKFEGDEAVMQRRDAVALVADFVSRVRG
jgi:hypothetical protein